jgi:hypothetical protein
MNKFLLTLLVLVSTLSFGQGGTTGGMTSTGQVVYSGPNIAPPPTITITNTSPLTSGTQNVLYPVQHSVQLDWTASNSSGVAGYNIYRSTTSGGPYNKINRTLVNAITFTDTVVLNGTTYFYMLRAFDGTLEGPNSSEATAVVPAVQLAATGGNPPYTWLDFGNTLPAGMSVDATTGKILGTPTASGSFTFVPQVKDVNNVATTKSLSLTISGTAQPVNITSLSPLPSATNGVLYQYQFLVSGGTAPYTWTKTGTWPTGLSMTTSGFLSGTPTVSGTSTVTVTVTDNLGATDSGSFSITVVTVTTNVTLPILPQNWVNKGTISHTGACDAPGGAWDETVYLGMTSNSCSANPAGAACDYVGTTGLQKSYDDWAAQTTDKWRHVIVAHGSDFQGTGMLNGSAAGVLLLNPKVVSGRKTSKCIAYESDTPLPSGQTACSHGIQDNVPGSTDIGHRNNHCDGTCVDGYRTGTGGACVGGGGGTTSHSVLLSWNSSSGATSYNVLRGTNTGGPYSNIASTASTTYTDSTVSGSQTYFYVITASNSSGTSAFSAEVQAIIPGLSNPVFNDLAKMWTITATNIQGNVIGTGTPVSGFGPSHVAIRDLEAHHTPNMQSAATPNTIALKPQTTAAATASDIYFDRGYFHEDVPDTGPTTTSNAISNMFTINCSSCAISNSYFDGIIRSGATNVAAEGHVISVANSPGPLAFVHNWMEGSSSSIFFGGNNTPTIPGIVSASDVEIRRNRFTYPKSWLGIAVPTGASMVRKNAFEVKNGVRILVDGNIFENVDSSGGQNGPIVVINQRSCSAGIACDDYLASISNFTFSNNIGRHACTGSQDDGRGGPSSSGVSVGEGADGVLWKNNLFYDTQIGNPGCNPPQISISTAIKFGANGSIWNGCSATKSGATVHLDCTGSPDNAIGMHQTDTRVGDLVQITGCTDTTYNTGTVSQRGVAAVSPTVPTDLNVYYTLPVAPTGTSTTGCSFTQYQGFPRNVTFVHNTIITKYDGTHDGAALGSGAGPTHPVFMQNHEIKNNVMIGGGWDSAGRAPDGTVTETSVWDGGHTILAHHNIWPTRVNTNYTEYNSFLTGTTPSTLWFPASNHCVGNPSSSCVGMVGELNTSSFNYNLTDWHNYRLCNAGDNACGHVASTFSAGGSGQADDSTDLGFSPSGIDAAETSTTYTGCSSNCGAHGPYPD